MSDKRTTLDGVAGLRSGMAIGIGGWGRCKPMAFARALLRTDITDSLTVVTYGGGTPDLDPPCSAGKVRRAYYGFVSPDIPALL